EGLRAAGTDHRAVAVNVAVQLNLDDESFPLSLLNSRFARVDVGLIIRRPLVGSTFGEVLTGDVVVVLRTGSSLQEAVDNVFGPSPGLRSDRVTLVLIPLSRRCFRSAD